MTRSKDSAPSSRARRWLVVLLVFLLLIAVLGLAALHYGTRWARQELLAALGPQSEILELNLRLSGVEILGLRLPAPRTGAPDDWPAADFLTAERVLMTPAWGDLVQGRLRLRRVQVISPTLSVVRGSSGLRVLPNLTESGSVPHAQALPGLMLAHAVVAEGVSGLSAQSVADFTKVAYTLPKSLLRLDIEQLDITGGTLEFFDVTIRKPALMFRVERVEARLSRISLPDLSGPITLSGLVKGKNRDGQLELRGEVNVAQKSADLHLALKNVDLPPFQAYFFEPTDADLSQGRFDLETRLQLQRGALKAPVQMTLSELALDSGGARFMGLPYGVALELLKDQQGRIELQFEVAGQTDAPEFSLNDILRREIGKGFFAALTRNISRIVPGWGAGIPGLNLERLFSPPEPAAETGTPEEPKPSESPASPLAGKLPPKGSAAPTARLVF